MTHVALLIALVQMQVPAWAFPVSPAAPGGPPGVVDTITPLHIPGSHAAFTEAQANYPFFVMDWFPDAHPPMPDVVARGRKPSVLACGYCHLADGAGRPENAMLSGLSASYIVAQMSDMRSGARKGASLGTNINAVPAARMADIARATTPDEVAQAARYFATVKPRQRGRVVEATELPKTVIGRGLYFRSPDGGVEPLGQRLIEIPEDAERHERHDPYVAYTTYVPPGSIAHGQTLAGTVCSSCHGPDLRGVALVPPLAGRSPSYLLRQLLAFNTGTRSSAAGAPMRAVATTLTLADMIAAAAYAGTLTP
jgi:cytochrome c553